jgi:transposase InsO family protein
MTMPGRSFTDPYNNYRYGFQNQETDKELWEGAVSYKYRIEDLQDAQEYANNWIYMYNNERPHESLNNLPPTMFLLKYGKLHGSFKRLNEFPTFQQDNNYIKQNKLMQFTEA